MSAHAAAVGVPGHPRVGRADLGWPASFTTAAGRAARRHGILDGTVKGRFGAKGEILTAAFVRLEVTSRWPAVTGADVRNNSGYLVYLVTPEEEASAGRISARLRMGDSSYRLLAPREILKPLVGAADAALAARLPERPSLWSEDLDGDGIDEIIASFRRQLALSARPEGRLHVFRMEGRAVVDLVSVPVIIPDVTEDFDFWGYLVADVTHERGGASRPTAITVTYARTTAAEDQRTDADPPNAFASKTIALPSR